VSTKREAPAAQRNRGPILEVLARLWPDMPGTPRRLVLEIASGTGEHAVHFAGHLPHVDWQPSDLGADAIASVSAWRDEAGLANLRAPVELDVRAPQWPLDRASDLFCANMIHIAPWSCTLGLVAGATRLLDRGGLLVLYGPFAIDGQHTAPSNAAFDADLRRRDPSWGVRDLAEVSAVADAAGFTLRERVSMPANNLVVVFERR
jgi:hypothetical protein